MGGGKAGSGGSNGEAGVRELIYWGGTKEKNGGSPRGVLEVGQ